MEKLMLAAGVDDARTHDTRRLVQSSLSELGTDAHVADMILDHSIKDAPNSRAAYNLYDYRKEKLAALTIWAKRLRQIVGEDLLAVMVPERTGFQGKGPTRRTGTRRRAGSERHAS